jgi:hypothetical protein
VFKRANVVRKDRLLKESFKICSANIAVNYMLIMEKDVRIEQGR